MVESRARCSTQAVSTGTSSAGTNRATTSLDGDPCAKRRTVVGSNPRRSAHCVQCFSTSPVESTRTPSMSRRTAFADTRTIRCSSTPTSSQLTNGAQTVALAHGSTEEELALMLAAVRTVSKRVEDVGRVAREVRCHERATPDSGQAVPNIERMSLLFASTAGVTPLLLGAPQDGFGRAGSCDEGDVFGLDRGGLRVTDSSGSCRWVDHQRWTACMPPGA